MTSLSDFFDETSELHLLMPNNLVLTRALRVCTTTTGAHGVVLRALRTIPLFLQSVKCFKINEIIKSLVEVHRNKEITSHERKKI